MNWHAWYWWTWPTAIAIGLAVNFAIACLIPPRQSVRDYLLDWKAAVNGPATAFRQSIRTPRTGQGKDPAA